MHLSKEATSNLSSFHPFSMTKTPGLRRQIKDLQARVNQLEYLIMHVVTEAIATKEDPIEFDPKLKFTFKGFQSQYNKETEMIELYGTEN